MSNTYIKNLHQKRTGSENFLDNLQSGFQDLTSGLQKKTGLTSKRIKNVSELSEVNMELTEDVLTKLDKTLSVYTITGYLLGSASALVIINEIRKLIQK